MLVIIHKRPSDKEITSRDTGETKGAHLTEKQFGNLTETGQNYEKIGYL